MLKLLLWLHQVVFLAVSVNIKQIHALNDFVCSANWPGMGLKPREIEMVIHHKTHYTNDYISLCLLEA